MALPAIDALNVSHGTALTTYSSNWTYQSGGFVGLGGTHIQVSTLSTDCWAYWNADSASSANQYVELDCNFESYQWIALAARWDTSANTAYFCVILNGDCYVYRASASNPDGVGALFTAPTSGQTVRLEVETNGSQVDCRVYYGGSLHVTRSDTSADRILSGSRGGFGSNSDQWDTAYFNNFEFGELSAGPGSTIPVLMSHYKQLASA